MLSIFSRHTYTHTNYTHSHTVTYKHTHTYEIPIQRKGKQNEFIIIIEAMLNIFLDTKNFLVFCLLLTNYEHYKRIIWKLFWKLFRIEQLPTQTVPELSLIYPTIPRITIFIWLSQEICTLCSWIVDTHKIKEKKIDTP